MRHSPEFHRQIRRARRRSSRGFQVALLVVVGLGGVLGAKLSEGARTPGVSRAMADAPASVRFGLCHSGGGANCVVDGDTFWLDGERIRISDIDAPETHPSRCAEEARLGSAATQRLHALLNQGPVTLAVHGRDTDRYDRKLRVVSRDGRSLGDQLVSEGLARPWTGRRQPWC